MSSRSEVLRIFKSLHKARLAIFQEDSKALEAARLKINEEFKKNKHVQDDGAINEMIKLGKDVEKEMRETIIQAVEVEPGVYEAKIREDVPKLINTPFNDDAVLLDGTTAKCCKDKSK